MEAAPLVKGQYYTINTRDRWLFTSPPKTATTTVRFTLKDKTFLTLDEYNILNKALPNPNHQTIYKFITAFPEASRFFKFGIVRNPYDRLVSLWWERGKPSNIPFLIFVDSIKNTSDYDTHSGFNKYQSDWYTDDTEIIRFENFAEEFCQVLSKIGIEKEVKDIRHTRRRGAKKKNFAEFYTSKRSKEYVYDLFKEDFLLYGYRKL